MRVVWELCGLLQVAGAVADGLSDSAPSFWTWQEQRGKAAVSGDWERPSEIRACQLRNCTPTAHVPSGQPSQLRPATCPERECYRIRWQRTKWVPEHPLFLCQSYLPATQARLYLFSSPFALLLFFLPRTSPRRPFYRHFDRYAFPCSGIRSCTTVRHFTCRSAFDQTLSEISATSDASARWTRTSHHPRPLSPLLASRALQQLSLRYTHILTRRKYTWLIEASRLMVRTVSR